MANETQRNNSLIYMTLTLSGEEWDFPALFGTTWMLKYDSNGKPYIYQSDGSIVVGEYAASNATTGAEVQQ